MRELNEMGKYTRNKFKIYFKIFFKLLYEMVYYRPSVVYLQISISGVAFIRDLLYVSIVKLFGVKLLYHIHSMGIKHNSRYSFYRYMYRYAFNKSEVIYLTKLITDDIKPVFNGKIHIVNNGMQDYSLIYKYLNISENSKKPKLLLVSNLLKLKGHDIFIEALSILNDRLECFEAYIIGAESDLTANDINMLIKNKMMSHKIHYVGPQYDKDKFFYYSSSDVFVFPTRHEVFPGVILEAMQFGIPVITTRVGGIPEIVDDGINGFIVDKNAPLQIADKLELLIKNPELRKKMGREARKKYLDNYTLHTFENNMKEVFDSVLNNENACK